MDAKHLETNMRVKHKENGRKLKFVGRGRGDEYCFITIGGSFTSSDFLTAEQVEKYEPIFKTKSQRPKSKTSTSIKLVYTSEDGKLPTYTVKRVIGFTVKTAEGRVNITSEKMRDGNFVVRENTTIPFSDLVAMIYTSPKEKLTFCFKDGKLESKTQSNLPENFVDYR